MTRFERVQQLLQSAVQYTSIGAHGNFWQDISRNDFVDLVIFGLPLITLQDGANSNLIKALNGQEPFDGSQYSQMPDGFNPMPADQIAFIRQWIDDGCPEDPFSQVLRSGDRSPGK